MRKARLLPAGRTVAVLVSTVLTLALAPSSAGAIEILAGPRIIQNDGEVLATSTALASGGGEWTWNARERCFMRRINRIRKRHGLRKLQWDKHLGVVGRRHARKLARSGGIWHDDIASKVTRWRSLGQNTGKGGGCKSLTRAFMHSSGHRANYLGGWRHMGVGAVRKNGSIYVQQVYESRRDPGNIWNRPN